MTVPFHPSERPSPETTQPFPILIEEQDPPPRAKPSRPRPYLPREPATGLPAMGVFDLARQLLVERGRTRARVVAPGGAICALAALAMAAGATLEGGEIYLTGWHLPETAHLATMLVERDPDLEHWLLNCGPGVVVTTWADREPDDAAVLRTLVEAATTYAA